MTARPAVNRRITLAIGAALALTGCGVDQDTPEALGQAVAEAANDADIEGIKNLTCTQDRDLFADDFDVAEARTSLKASELDIAVTFTKAVRNGKTATLTFTTTLKNVPKSMRDMDMPTTTTSTINAVETDGTWQLCNPRA